MLFWKSIEEAVSRVDSETVGDDTLFLDGVKYIESKVARECLLAASDREFPEDLHRRVVETIRLQRVRGATSEYVLDEIRFSRRSLMVESLREVFEDLVTRDATRFGAWSIDPTENVRQAYLVSGDGPSMGNLGSMYLVAKGTPVQLLVVRSRDHEERLAFRGTVTSAEHQFSEDDVMVGGKGDEDAGSHLYVVSLADEFVRAGLWVFSLTGETGDDGEEFTAMVVEEEWVVKV